MSTELPAYANPSHPSNKIRPKLKCWGCGTKGVVGKHWGQWCFKCNVERIGRIDARFEPLRAAMAAEPSTATPWTGTGRAGNGADM